MNPTKNRKNLEGVIEDIRNFAYSYLEKYNPSKQQLKTYLFKKLMNGDWADTLSERQEKETLDIVIFRVTKPTIVVRVQDKHHDSILKTSQDLVQKQMLEWNGCIVVDLWHKECPTLWSEEVNEKSIEEISVYLRKANLI